MNNRAAGARGEARARAYLEEQGFEILEMNYRRRTGEIDIIAREGRYTVFVEVKQRSNVRYGRPAEAVTPAKQAHILRTAITYVQEHGLEETPMRFDIIEVTSAGVQHIRSAFDASDFDFSGYY